MAVPGAAAADLPLETYTRIVTRMFITCPAIVPAVTCLCRLGVGGRVLGAVPPADPVVVLLGDRAAWQPPQAGPLWEARVAEALWLHMHLGLLHAIWRVRSVRAATPQGAAVSSMAAAKDVSMAAAAIKHNMCRDWHRVHHDVRSESGFSTAMFSCHTGLMLMRVALEQRWCVCSAFTSVAEGGW